MLESGNVYVEKMQTKDAHGKEIKVDDGMIHHWYGSIFIPNIKLETLIHGFRTTTTIRIISRKSRSLGSWRGMATTSRSSCGWCARKS